MRNHLVVVLATIGIGLAGPALGQDPAPAPEPDAPAGAIREDDVSLTCVQLGDEAARLSQTMGGEPEGSLFGMLGGVVRSGASMIIPGAGVVIAGADAVTKPGRDRREAEAVTIENRWHYLNGLYAGQRCHAQIEARAEAAADAARGAPATGVAPASRGLGQTAPAPTRPATGASATDPASTVAAEPVAAPSAADDQGLARGRR